MATSPSPWSRTARGMRERVDAAMDRMADLIKNALLDGLELTEEDEVAPAPVGPIDPDELVRRMRARVETTLRQVAVILNASPDESTTAAEEATCDLFSELWLEALKVAAELRLGDGEDKEPEPPAEGQPQGEWARRYRQMQADDPE